MRILVVIPHFCQQKSDACRRSELTSPEERGNILSKNIASLHHNFGREQYYIGKKRQECNSALSSDIDIVICTVGSKHALKQISGIRYENHSVDVDPEMLGYECQAVLAEKIGQYDMYCYLEDDIKINDPLFFWKLNWFSEASEDKRILQPNRFEISKENFLRKTYIDGPLGSKSMVGRFQSKNAEPHLSSRIFGRSINFELVNNPHAGCFFLNERQMRLWMSKSYFLDRSKEFVGALEGAATLGIMRTFDIYKPSSINASFFEIQHMDPRYRWNWNALSESYELNIAFISEKVE